MGTDGHTDMTKLKVACINFVSARNKNQVYTDIKMSQTIRHENDCTSVEITIHYT
jgi:hypothetical protein